MGRQTLYLRGQMESKVMRTLEVQEIGETVAEVIIFNHECSAFWACSEIVLVSFYYQDVYVVITEAK